MTLDNHSNIAARLQDAATQIPGWTSYDQLLTLFNLALASAGMKGDMVEIGSWCGRTAIALGLAAKTTGNTRLHCIDLFPERKDWRENPDGTYSFTVATEDEVVSVYKQHALWREPFERDVLAVYEKYPSGREVLMEAVQRHGLTDFVTVHRGTSRVLGKRFPPGFKCRLAFVDGDHSYEAVCADIRNLEPVMIEGGWICLDDAFTVYAGVDRAIEELILTNPKYDVRQQLTRKLFVARRAPA